MFGVPSEPNSGKMAPTKLALNNVSSILESITDSDGMIASSPVIVDALILRCVVAPAALAHYLFLLPFSLLLLLRLLPPALHLR